MTRLRRCSFALALLPACALWAAPAAKAQTTSSGDAFQNQFPDPLRYAPPVPEPPELQFASVDEIELNGPLVSGPHVAGERIAIRTAAGLFHVSWTDSLVVGVEDAERPPTEEPEGWTWAMGPDGKDRAKAVTDRLLLVQKACRGCNSGWRRRWRLRVPGLAPAKPVVTAKRVYYGSADNRVYGVRRRNGHRIWATALDGRVLRELALWVDPEETGKAGVAAILAVPEPGAELVVLDAYSGTQVLRYRLADAGDAIVGSAITTADGHVILARQGYTDDDAGLIVLKLVHLAEKPPPGEPSATSSYNPPASNEDAPVVPAPGPGPTPPPRER